MYLASVCVLPASLPLPPSSPSFLPSQSVTALSATKRDLAEFVSVLSSDTTDAVKHAGMNIKGLMQVENVRHTYIVSTVRFAHSIHACMWQGKFSPEVRNVCWRLAEGDAMVEHFWDSGL